MPTSQWRQITPIIDKVVRLSPHSVLDVGVGNGKYGFLCREYLDLDQTSPDARFGQRRAMIHGIEVFEPYITDVQRAIYDRIFVGDAREVVPSLTEVYDVVLLVDVLEHFDQRDAVSLLTELKRIGRHIIISVPSDAMPQAAVFGNEYETHRHSFTGDELRSLGFQVLSRVGGSWVGIWGPRAMEFYDYPGWWKAMRPLGRLFPGGMRQQLVTAVKRLLWPSR